LCVLDDEVRDLSEPQRFGLVTLARQVMALLELRRALAQRDRARAARDAAEDKKILLTRELHHRVKNTLAVVQAVAGSTARSSTNVHQFRASLSGRIGALAKTHAIITSDDDQVVSLRGLFEVELGGEAEARVSRVKLDGPPVNLPSEIAVPLGLAIHEMISNSRKFGALSEPEGEVRASWTTTAKDAPELVVLHWREHGGPEVHPPRQHGFGSRMLDRVLGAQIGAKVVTDYRPEGLQIEITFGLPGNSPG
jgi:two-component sensor histidine kinase